MEARFITDAQQWNDFVAASPYGNITQSYEWGEFAKDAGSTPLHIGVIDDEGKLCAAILILVTKLPVLKSNFFYAPRGPIIADPNSPAFTLLLNFIKSEARKYRAVMLKLEPGVEDGDQHWIISLQRRGFRTSPQWLHIRNEWILDIRPDEKALLAQMKEKWRYNIRLAGRKGVTVRRATGREDIEKFYTLLQETSERDQFYIHSLEHFETFMQIFEPKGMAAMFLAEHDGKPVAGNVLMKYGKWCWYRYGASSGSSRSLMPNHLLQWNGIRWAKEQGCDYYNFIGIPATLEEPAARKDPLWGVYTFKRGFNGFARLSLPGYDLPYNPVIYQVYRRMLDFKAWRDARREAKAERLEQEKSAAVKPAAPSVPSENTAKASV
jgi:Uncharacterized protein involved in methicillin resistance